MKVTVVMLAYNHSQFIAQAIEGVMMQQTDFPVELIIGDDCSTDNTCDIIRSFAEKFPSRIKPYFNAVNRGMNPNFISVYNRADGEYIALCEGDDFWTDPLKLEKQVTFLENHPDVSFSFHNVDILDQHTGLRRPHFNPHTMMPQYTLNNLLSGNFIQTCSVVYRRKNVSCMPEWFASLPMGDWPLHILHAEHGPFRYIDEIMGVYRIVDSGAWANHPAFYRIEKSIQTALYLNTFLNHKYTPQLNSTVVKWYNNLIDGHLRNRDTDAAFTTMLEAVGTVKDTAPHTPFLAGYLSLFIDTIATLVRNGKEAEALSVYTTNADKLPFIRELRVLDSLMSSLRSRHSPPAATTPRNDATTMA